jgi:hypothetical protein
MKAVVSIAEADRHAPAESHGWNETEHVLVRRARFDVTLAAPSPATVVFYG